MGLISGLLKGLINISIYFAILIAIILLIPNLPPYTKFTSIDLEPGQPRVGSLAPNGALNNADKKYVNKLLGPEAFQLHRGELYTSLATGEIVKISSGGHVTFVTKLGQPCTGLSQEHICGRPLGFQIDEKNNVMYVVDTYHGIWRVDLKNDKKQLLVSPRVAIEGRKPKLFNSLALSKNGDFYWTDSTSDYHLKDGAMSSLSDPTGRLFLYNSAKNQSKVLLDNLWFPNGLIVSPDNQFVVAVESFRYRLMKYYIDGPKKGKSEVFVAGLPGVPDNLRVLPDGSGALVALYVTFDDEEPMLARSLAAAPLARKLLARVQRLVEIPFEYLNSLYPHVMFDDIVYHIGHFKSMSDFMPKQSGLVVVDWNGNIIESYYNTDGSLGHISDAIVYNNRLYTGNPHLQNFIGSVPIPPLLQKAFTLSKSDKVKLQQKEEAKSEIKKEAPKPVAQEKPVPKQAKPIETAKPTPKPAAAKPVEPKPTPKPATTKPVEQPKPTPKPATTKPVKQPKPTTKPASAKPVEQPKPTTKPASAKPVEQPKPTTKPASAKPVEQPKPTTKPASAKPVEQPKPTTKPTPAQKQEKPTPKPEAKATAKPAQSENNPEVKAKPRQKAAEPNYEEPIVIRKEDEPVPEIKNKLAPENIPIKEEIPSDTVKPNKETLKVIKRGGPAEIPNPHP